ncbi:MAG: hypothetical protein J7M18_02880, partial [Candidatus Eremiobacteraeota bacterium]|nr:hypothetical protein [Candidatus Eremiobacteraeota bacterium]
LDYMLESYEFNEKLIEWLVWYDDRCPHQSPWYRTLLDVILESKFQPGILWTGAFTLLGMACML